MDADEAVIHHEIDRKVRSRGVFDSLHDLVRKYSLESSIKESEIMASIIRHMNDQTLRNAFPEENANKADQASYTYRELVVYIDGGKAFVDNLLEQDSHKNSGAPLSFGSFGDGRSTLELTMQLGSRRVRTPRVKATVEPDFEGECYRFPLHHPSEPLPTIESLVDMKQLMSIRVVKRDGSGGSPSLVSCQEFEWRKVLVHGKLQVSLPLRGVGDMTGPAGLLEMRLEIVPLRVPLPPNLTKKEAKHEAQGAEVVAKTQAHPVFVAETTIEKQIQHEERVEAGVVRRFHAFAKAWWKEYTDIRPPHRYRLVRLFARDAGGVQSFVSTFLSPIEVPHSLDTPLHAARFVALLPRLEADQHPIGAGNTEVGSWSRALTCLSVAAGTEADKAILLASLLLGFGLDAYVCVGVRRRKERKHNLPSRGNSAAHKPPEAVLVVTRVSKSEVCLWEPQTGRRGFLHTQEGWTPGKIGNGNPRWECPLESIHSVFNDKELFANVQPVDLIETCNWNFADQRKWKLFTPEAIRVLTPAPPVSLFPYSGNRRSQEIALESSLRKLVKQYRKDECRLGTVWSDKLAYRLGPALAAYEAERCTGVTFGNMEFQQAIKRHIPVGHVFKAIPFHFNHRSSRRMLASFLGSSRKEGRDAQQIRNGGRGVTATDLLKSTGDSVRFAVRVRIFPFPEDTCATWVILAVKYREVD